MAGGGCKYAYGGGELAGMRGIAYKRNTAGTPPTVSSGCTGSVTLTAVVSYTR